MTAAAQAGAIVDELARGGVAEVVLAPGSRSAPLVVAAEAHPRLRLHVRVDERSAAFTALGLARASGRPAMALCTSGTAAASFHPAVLEADAAGVPLVAVTADRPPELRDAGANQTIDQQRLYGTAARAVADLQAAHDLLDHDVGDQVRTWRSEVARLLAAARGRGGAANRPGPVQLNVCLREPLVGDADAETPPGRAGGRAWTTVRGGSPLPGDADLAELARSLAGVERGLIVAGEGAVPSGRGLPPAGWPDDPGRGGAAIDDLARRLGWPLIAEPTSQARRGPCAVECADAVLRSEAFVAAHRPDLILRLGRAVLARPLGSLLADDDAEQIVVSHGGRWHDPARSATTIIDGEPDRVAAAVAARLDDRADAGADLDDPADAASGPTWLDAWRGAGAAARAAIDEALDEGDVLGEARLARDLVAALPPEAVLVVGSSRPIRDVDEYAAARDDVIVVGNRGVSGIDGFASTAMGVALGTTRPVVALTGDLAVLHDAAGLARLGSPEPDLVLVIVDNDGGGIFAGLPPGGLPEPLRSRFTTPHGVDLTALAGAFGIDVADVDRAGALGTALAHAHAERGVRALRVPTDRDATAAEHTALRAAAVDAVDRVGRAPRPPR